MPNRWLENWIHLERFVNDGSPNRQSFVQSVSAPTHPLYALKSFPVATIKSSKNDTYFRMGKHAIDHDISDIGIPIHPDVSKFLRRSFLDNYNAQYGDLDCIPTAAPRTLFVNTNTKNPYFIKLSYPEILGRFPSPLTREKGSYSLNLSEYIINGIKDTPINFGWFQETGFVSADIFQEPRRNGDAVCIFREIIPICKTGQVSNVSHALPLFSVLAESDKGAFESAIGYQNSSSLVEQTWERVLKPIIESSLNFFIFYGLVPEIHAQNIVFFIQHDPTSGQENKEPLIAWRDALSFKIVGSHSRVRHSEIRSNRYIKDDDTLSIELSCCFDGMLDEYIIGPLITKTRMWTYNADILRCRAAELIRDRISENQIPLPLDGWFSRSSAPIENGQTLRPRFFRGRSGIR